LLAPLGIADFLGVAATDAAGDGCLIGAPLPRVTSMANLDGAALAAVAAHLTAGMRMRRKTSAPVTDDAVPIWAALVAGRWKVVDAFDREGSRFLLATQSDGPARAARPQLTAREHEVLAHAAKGHSNKLIAHEMGLAPSTVAGHLTKAALKLGVGSRVELMRAFVRRK
jgi:DNA-binding CsgD family transcriptional regulator